MKRNCGHCSKPVTRKNSVETENKGRFIHLKCLEYIVDNILNPLSLNVMLPYEDDHIELQNLIPEQNPSVNDLRLDLEMAIKVLRKRNRKLEAVLLAYFLDGYTQRELPEKLHVSKQRVSQLVKSLRNELQKLGLTDYLRNL